MSITAPSGLGLDQTAAMIVAEPALPGSNDLLLIALRPSSMQRRVIATPGNSAVRAAISVAVAAGNLRPWSTATSDALVDVPLNALPEIVRASLTPQGIHAIRVGAVTDPSSDEAPVCWTMWLSTATVASPEADLRHLDALRLLADGIAQDRRRLDAELAIAAAQPSIAPVADAPRAEVELADGSSFLAALHATETDEMAVMAFEIEADEDHLRRCCAALATATRRDDCVARLDQDTFAVMLVDVDRRTAFEISRRLRAVLAEATDARTDEPSHISVGFAHEVGLIDPDELFDSARSAMREARAHGGTMLVAC